VAETIAHTKPDSPCLFNHSATDSFALNSVNRFLNELDRLWAFYTHYNNSFSVDRSEAFYKSYQYQIDRAASIGFRTYRDETGRHHEATP
jgi:hypothetical protein